MKDYQIREFLFKSRAYTPVVIALDCVRGTNMQLFF